MDSVRHSVEAPQKEGVLTDTPSSGVDTYLNILISPNTGGGAQRKLCQIESRLEEPINGCLLLFFPDFSTKGLGFSFCTCNAASD